MGLFYRWGNWGSQEPFKFIILWNIPKVHESNPLRCTEVLTNLYEVSLFPLFHIFLPFFLIASLFSVSLSLSLPGSSLSFIHISDLSAASLGIISPSSDVQTQISKTSFLKVQTLLGACRGSLTWQWYETRNASSCYLSENIHLTIWKFWHWDHEKV